MLWEVGVVLSSGGFLNWREIMCGSWVAGWETRACCI